MFPTHRRCRRRAALPSSCRRIGKGSRPCERRSRRSRGQTHRDWILRVVGADPARRRVVEQIAATDPRIAWIEAGDERRRRGRARRGNRERRGLDLAAGRTGAASPQGARMVRRGRRASGSERLHHRRGDGHARPRAPRYSSPEFRQVVDYDTLLETNPFGETVAVERDAYAGVADGLATHSIAAARSSLLLTSLMTGRSAHSLCAGCP